MKRNFRGPAALVCLLIACASGCNSKQKQLENVAKDWCLTIRASQVIPVYPMTEDLQPGDVFLVQRTVDEQHQAYTKSGFLAFENHIARLDPTGYDHSYGRSFYLDTEHGLIMPRAWLEPAKEHSFGRAPGAAFPAYSFSVSSGEGFSAALPIQGVPVGLSLMNSSSATGSVTIKDSRTYGIDIMSMLADVQTWADEPDTITFLRSYAPENQVPSANGQTPPTRNFVRVIHRVFLTGKLNVSLTSTSAFSGGASVGVPKPVELPLLEPPKDPNLPSTKTANAESYKAGLKGLTESLNAAAPAAGDALPGATLKVVSSSARSVSIDETFARPIVIGYLGFDMAVLPGGTLGPPIATHAVLENNVKPSDQDMPRLRAARVMEQIGLYRGIDAIATGGGADKARAQGLVQKINDAARPLLPATYPAAIWSLDRSGRPVAQIAKGQNFAPGASAYRDLVTYREQLRSSASKLRAIDKPTPEQQADLIASARELDRIDARWPDVGAPLHEASKWMNGS